MQIGGLRQRNAFHGAPVGYMPVYQPVPQPAMPGTPYQEPMYQQVYQQPTYQQPMYYQQQPVYAPQQQQPVYAYPPQMQYAPMPVTQPQAVPVAPAVPQVQYDQQSYQNFGDPAQSVYQVDPEKYGASSRFQKPTQHATACQSGLNTQFPVPQQENIAYQFANVHMS